MTLKLTPTEAAIVNALKSGDMTTLELNEVLGIRQIESTAVKTAVSRLNSKRKIILTPKEIGGDKYRLQENDIEYQIVEEVRATRQGLEAAKKEIEDAKDLVCGSCVHKAKDRETKILIIVSGIVGLIIGSLIAFLISMSILEPVLEMEVEVDAQAIADEIIPLIK